MSEFNFELADNYHRIYKRQDGLGLEIPTQAEVLLPLFHNTSDIHCLASEGISALPISFQKNNSTSYEHYLRPQSLFTSIYNNLAVSIYRTLVEELKTVGMKEIVVSPTFMSLPSDFGSVTFDGVGSNVQVNMNFVDFTRKVYNDIRDNVKSFDDLLADDTLFDSANPEHDKAVYDTAASEITASIYSYNNNQKQRRICDLFVNKPSEDAVDTHKYLFDSQVVIAIGEDPDYFPYDFAAGENTVFIWMTPWRMKAPVVGKIPAGENVNEYLTKILPMCISEENDYTNFTFINQSTFRDKLKAVFNEESFVRDFPDLVSLLKIFTSKEAITLKAVFNNLVQLRMYNRSSTSSYENEIFSKFEDIFVNIDLAERVSNMLAISTAIDLYSRKENAGKVVFTGLLSQTAIANIMEQMFEHMPVDSLPAKLTPKLTSINKVNPVFNVIGAGGIGSVFGEFFANYDFDTFTNYFTSMARNKRNRYRLAITDMDDIEPHNLNRSSIFSFEDIVQNRMKVNAISEFISRSNINESFLAQPVYKVLDGPYTNKSRKELYELFVTGTGRFSVTQANKGHVIDCRDVLSVDYTIEKTSLKLSYNGDKRLGFHFNLDRFIENLFIMPGSNYDVVPSFCVPPKFSVALGVLFVNIPFFDKYAAEYAELNVETLINASSETIL